MKGRKSESGRYRVGVSVLLLIIVVVVIALVAWGTSWTIPEARTSGVKYELVGYWDGTGAPSGKLLRPIGIGVAPSGDVYVTDARNRVVHFNTTGEFKGEWGKNGNAPGEFSNPIGVVVAPDGAVLVSDYNLDRVQKFTYEGKFILSFGASGKGPGQFDAPAGLATDSSGDVYVADFYNHRIEKFGSDGSFQATIGHPGRLGAGAVHYPTDATVLRDGNLLVADAYNYQLHWFDPQGKSIKRVGYHLFWLWPRLVSSNSGFKVPTSVAEGPDTFLHVADSGNHRVVMLTAKGERITDWVIQGADPNIFSPEHIAVSPDGTTVYATDLQGNRILVLRVVRARQGQARFSGAQPPTKIVTIPVEGMVCVSCTASVKNALKSIDGVTDVEVSLESRTARVQYVEGRTSLEQLVAAINHLGYRAGAPQVEETR